MTAKDQGEPLRGDAAWRAAKQKVADNNEAAFKRGREQRQAQDAKVAKRDLEADRREHAQLPQQPDFS